MATRIKANEFEGNTVDEAIRRAAESLGVSRENMTIRILSEGQRGLFGMGGASPAKIKVFVKNRKRVKSEQGTDAEQQT